jgi:predicted ATP-grasp superfamily ATP-dependent carboligase
MRIFVYEYVCGGGLAGQPLPESLRREGWAMLTAVLDDFRRCAGVQTITLLDCRFSPPAGGWAGTHVDFVEPGAEASLYRKRTRDADFTLVIAPETDGLLYQRCCWTEEAGGRLLGPSPQAVHLAGDKTLLAHVWRQTSIPTPPLLALPESGPTNARRVVCKPRRGAGSRGVCLITNLADFMATLRRFGADGADNGLLLQELAPGMPASVSVLIGRGHCLALPAAAQHLSDDGRFRYQGGCAPWPDALNDRAQKLALRAIAPVDGLSGYVGVDLVLGDSPDGSSDVAIEINPRLTTSYVGLRVLAKFNLAETMLALALHRRLPERRYREGLVWWTADGTVQTATVQ